MDANRGLIDASARSLNDLLERPIFKDTLRAIFSNIDPDSSRDLVKAALWHDPEVFLAFLGVLPDIANAIIKAVDEFFIQLKEKFPPKLLNEFVESMIHDIDRESARRGLDNLKNLLNDLSPAFKKTWQEINTKEGGQHGQ